MTTVTIREIPPRYLKSVNASCWIEKENLKSPTPWTGHTRVFGPIDERWRIETTGQEMIDLEGIDDFEALFDAGDGEAGFFSAYDPRRKWPRGTAAGLTGSATSTFSDGTTFSDGSYFLDGITQCRVGNAAARGSQYIRLIGLTASQSVGFATGDQFAITQNGEPYGFLHRAISNTPTDAAGTCTVQIRPRLREPVAANQIVRLHRPRGLFRLMDGSQGMLNVRYGRQAQPTLSLVEAPEVLLCSI